MRKLIVFTVFVMLAISVKASEHQMIDTLGASPAGQFVALEEYGYESHDHSYYVRIKVMNVWKKQYVGKVIEVELPALRPVNLKKARQKARMLAQEELKKYQISG